MISNAEKNYYLNMPLTIIGFACLISGFVIGDRSLSFGGINIRSLISLVTTILVSLGICYASGIIGARGNEDGHFSRGQNQSMQTFDQGLDRSDSSNSQ